MSQMFAGRMIAAAVSFMFAVWDIRFRKAPLWMFAAFFFTGAFFAAMTGRTLPEVAYAAVPGGFLILLSLVTEGAIGMGDGLFFVAAAGFLQPEDSIFSLLIAIFLAAVSAMILYAVKRDRKASVPFLAMVPPAILILAVGKTVF